MHGSFEADACGRSNETHDYARSPETCILQEIKRYKNMHCGPQYRLFIDQDLTKLPDLAARRNIHTLVSKISNIFRRSEVWR
jgi:hypothetical protein